MIEKVTKVDDSEYPFLDDEGVSHKSKTDYLQTSVLGFCACGDPCASLTLIRDVLDLLEKGKGSNDEIKKLLPSDGLYYLVLYWLDDKKFTEHGSSVGGSWLTNKGKELLNDINWCLENEKDS